MRLKFIITMILFACLQNAVIAQEFATPEGKAIADEVRSMIESFNQGNADDLIEKTHPAIYTLVGGEENFKSALRSGAKQVMDLGIQIESTVIEAPESYHKAGDEVVCFVPMSMVMVVNGKRIQSKSFMIGARRGEQNWRYLDGAGLRKNRELLWTLFPGLDTNLQLPENTVGLLNPAVQQSGTDQPATVPQPNPQ